MATPSASLSRCAARRSEIILLRRTRVQPPLGSRATLRWLVRRRPSAATYEAAAILVFATRVVGLASRCCSASPPGRDCVLSLQRFPDKQGPSYARHCIVPLGHAPGPAIQASRRAGISPLRLSAWTAFPRSSASLSSGRRFRSSPDQPSPNCWIMFYSYALRTSKPTSHGEVAGPLQPRATSRHQPRAPLQAASHNPGQPLSDRAPAASQPLQVNQPSGHCCCVNQPTVATLPWFAGSSVVRTSPTLRLFIRGVRG